MLKFGNNEKDKIQSDYLEKAKKSYHISKMINDSLGIVIRAPWFNDEENFGFLAQDVLKEFPELVAMDSTSGLYAVNYIGFIPLLLEAVKSQQQQIEELNKALEKLKKNEFK